MMWTTNQGDLKITGPGYEGVEPSDQTDGANAGKLKYYRNDGHFETSSMKYIGGYGAWVVAGETYIISGIQRTGDTPRFSFSDIHVPNTEGIAPEDEYVTLILQMADPTDGFAQLERECRIDAGHSRKWLGSNGVAHGYECGDCCQAIFDMTSEIDSKTTKKSATTSTTLTDVDPDPCKGCGSYDFRCGSAQDPHGGLGCNACERPKCRICKSDDETSHWINCSTIPTQRKLATTTIVTTSTTPSSTTTTNLCNGCGTYDARCWTSQDPHGGLGCNACGKPKCRYCKSDDSPSPWIKCSTIPP